MISVAVFYLSDVHCVDLLNLDKMGCHRVRGTCILKFGKYIHSIDISRLLAYYGLRILKQLF